MIAQLNYLWPFTARPTRIYLNEPPGGIVESNAEFRAHRVTIADARALERPLTIDREGLAFQRYSFSPCDFTSDEEIRRVYYPEVERLLLATTGAARVLIFDHTIRASPRTADSAQREPVFHVHVDYTAESAGKRLRQILGPPAGRLLEDRYAIVNVWRPLVSSVRAAPLAVADGSKVKSRCLIPAELIYPHRAGAIYYVTYDRDHAWFYLPDMTAEEIWIFKSYDSAASSGARYVPHSAFELDGAQQTGGTRRSIEIRAMVSLPQRL